MSRSFTDVIDDLLRAGAITQDAYSLMKNNYECFEQNKADIEQQHPHEWVASLDNDIFAAPSLHQLKATIERRPCAEYAYIVQIP